MWWLDPKFPLQEYWWTNLAVVKAGSQTAKFNSLSNLPAIRYILNIQYTSSCGSFLPLKLVDPSPTA